MDMIKLANMLRSRRGATQVLITLSLTAIFGFSALVLDVGLMFIEKNKLSKAADAAALAGAQELPANPAKAAEIAKDYAEMNGAPGENVQVTVSENNTKIEVQINNDVNFLFAKLIGFDKGNVSVDSAAIIGPVTEVYDAIRPLAIEEQTLIYGQQVVLKENAGDGSSGNYGAVSLGGTGSKVLENNIKYGYKGKLKVGDVIYTETGNIAGPVYDGVDYVTSMDPSTFEDFDRDSIRIWIIPVVDTLEVDGTKPVTVVGFAAFFLENAYKQSGQTEITGRFIEFVTNGDISQGQVDYGLKGVKLIE